jgi:peptidyl-prolyl cis-trans isomerase SurA
MPQMKKLFLLFLLALSTGLISAQTLITYGNNTISKQEFLRAYNKNKPTVTDKEKALREYVALYTNFKLKVKAAEELRLDTLQQIKYDIENFRNQILENYLSNEKGIKALQEQAFNRSQKDIHVLHFFVPITATEKLEDSLKAFNAINDVYKALRKGNTDYTSIVTNASPTKWADIGFITVFTVPYEYENIIYNTRVGEVAKPYRANNGWHIFKVVEERPSVGKWKIAQILFSFPPDANAEAKEAIKQKADSVYHLLQHGLSFGDAAKAYSNDKLTYLTNGEMPEFGTGKYAYSFEEEIFKLKKVDEISAPFESAFGYHIVKLLGFTPTPKTMSDEAYQLELKQKIMQDTRMDAEKEKFAKEIVGITNFKPAKNISENDLFRYADTLMKNPTIERTEGLPISNKVIATFTNGTVKGSDWLKFVRDYKANYENFKGESNKQLWDKFSTVSSVDYYKKNLESYSKDFKYQMEEFKEGNMLFEIMERNVWNKAIADTAGLLKYYEANKSKYKWTTSADVLIFNCNNSTTAAAALAKLKSGIYWKMIASESNAELQADSGRYELSQITGNNNTTTPPVNSYSKISTNSDSSSVFVKYIHIYPNGEQRNFDDAKGLVINDYQNVLEQEWLKQLRIKYPVKVNEAVLKKLLTP